MRLAFPFVLVGLGCAAFAARGSDLAGTLALAGTALAVLVGVGVAAWRRMPDEGLPWLGLALYATPALTVDLLGAAGAFGLAGGVGLVALGLVARRGWRRAGLLSLGVGGLPPIFLPAVLGHPLPTMAAAGLVAALAWAWPRRPLALVGLAALDVAASAVFGAEWEGGAGAASVATVQLGAIAAPLALAWLVERVSGEARTA